MEERPGVAAGAGDLARARQLVTAGKILKASPLCLEELAPVFPRGRRGWVLDFQVMLRSG